MATTIVDRDKGYARLLQATRERLPGLSVGVLTDEQHKDAEGLTVAEIGEIHELGLGVPARPWLRPVVDGRTNFVRERLKRVAQAVALGRLTAAAGMDLLGQDLVNAIRARIRAGIAPELAESTKAQKGENKDTPLIHTAQFIGAITHKVAPDGEKAGT
jgi:hypothetical protein